jgi:dTDP-4-dehydrorhamnose reductase
MTRWLITGAGGMLGADMLEVLRLSGADADGLSRSQLDIADADAVLRAVDGVDVVVNCAAWTDVDAAESHAERAELVNGEGPRFLALACRSVGARLVQVSTDYVFSGAAVTPYDEDAPLSPRSAYGRSKAVGETNVRSVLPASSYIVRTAWLYGLHGRNFVRTMIGLERTNNIVDVVDDQRGQPTWSMDVARQIEALVASAAPAGTYHATASGETSWFGLARAVFHALGADPERVRPTSSDRVQRAAPRPEYSVLGHAAWGRIGLDPIADWETQLAVALPIVMSGSAPS